MVTFEANSVKELQQAFIYSVDDYLETCKKLVKEPNKFFKGAFNVRTSRSVHRYLAVIAEKKMKPYGIVNKAFDFSIENEDEVLH